MDSNKETFETWNKVASLYEEKFMHLDLYNTSYDYILNALVNQRAKILEIGCGPGNITRYLLSRRPDLDIFGIDIAGNMIELAKKNNPTARFAVMDSRQIAALETKYDGIVCGFCLPYLSYGDCTKLIEDSYRLLTDNGLIYLSFVEGDQAMSGFKTGSTGDRAYFYYHNLEALKQQLTACSFEDIAVARVEYKRTESDNEIHTILTAKKKATA